ncbi:MAG: hypothetical protein WC700_18855 [Gemmatimonadaceae bacterium]|jgi:hypothetical protein
MTPAERRTLQEMLEDLVPVAEAAMRKGVARDTMLAAGKRGDVEMVSFQGKWYVAERSLLRWTPHAKTAHVRGCRE